MHKISLFNVEKGKQCFVYKKSDKGHSRNCHDCRTNDTFYVR